MTIEGRILFIPPYLRHTNISWSKAFFASSITFQWRNYGTWVMRERGERKERERRDETFKWITFLNCPIICIHLFGWKLISYYCYLGCRMNNWKKELASTCESILPSTSRYKYDIKCKTETLKSPWRFEIHKYNWCVLLILWFLKHTLLVW